MPTGRGKFFWTYPKLKPPDHHYSEHTLNPGPPETILFQLWKDQGYFAMKHRDNRTVSRFAVEKSASVPHCMEWLFARAVMVSTRRSRTIPHSDLSPYLDFICQSSDVDDRAQPFKPSPGIALERAKGGGLTPGSLSTTLQG